MTKKKKVGKKKLSNSKLLFLSLILLFIVFEALYIVRGNTPTAPQVAGAATQR